jgi:hypothetical protein
LEPGRSPQRGGLANDPLPVGRVRGLPGLCSRLTACRGRRRGLRILADGQIAQFAAIASFMRAGLLLIRSGLGLVYERRVTAGVEVLAMSVHTTAVTA